MYLKVDNRADLRGRSCVLLEGDWRRMFGPSQIQTNCIHSLGKVSKKGVPPLPETKRNKKYITRTYFLDQ